MCIILPSLIILGFQVLWFDQPVVQTTTWECTRVQEQCKIFISKPQIIQYTIYIICLWIAGLPIPDQNLPHWVLVSFRIVAIWTSHTLQRDPTNWFKFFVKLLTFCLNDWCIYFLSDGLRLVLMRNFQPPQNWRKIYRTVSYSLNSDISSLQKLYR